LGGDVWQMHTTVTLCLIVIWQGKVKINIHFLLKYNMNAFINPEIAINYDSYYKTDFGKKVDLIEKKIITELLKNVPRNFMLELGCGTGHWSDYFEKQGFNVLGIDISEPMLKLAIEKNINAKFLKADSHYLPFTNKSFSIVSSITMLEFVDDQDKVLQEIYRVLKPGGWLIIGCLNDSSVLGERKEQDEIFKNAKFLKAGELKNKLQLFGKSRFNCGIYLSHNFEILDGSRETSNIEPVFIGVIVQKRINI
jgi:ubiquinone/menaquinone biosynthesis C-methylase UbiE